MISVFNILLLFAYSNCIYFSTIFLLKIHKNWSIIAWIKIFVFLLSYMLTCVKNYRCLEKLYEGMLPWDSNICFRPNIQKVSHPAFTCWKLTIETLEEGVNYSQYRRSGVFIVKFEYISHLLLVFLLLTLNM